MTDKPRNPNEILNDLLDGVQSVAPNTGALARELRQSIAALESDLALLTPVSVPTTGQPENVQRFLLCDTRIELHFNRGWAAIDLRKGTRMDDVIRSLADLCIEVAK